MPPPPAFDAIWFLAKAHVDELWPEELNGKDWTLTVCKVDAYLRWLHSLPIQSA